MQISELDITRIALYDSDGKKIGVFKPSSIEIESNDYTDMRGNVVRTMAASKEFSVTVDLNGSVFDEAYAFNCPSCNAKIRPRQHKCDYCDTYIDWSKFKLYEN